MAKKNRKQLATPEEIAMMKRADEMASGISSKPETTEVIKEEVVAEKPKGVTVIDAGLQNIKEEEIQSQMRLGNTREEAEYFTRNMSTGVTTYTPEQVPESVLQTLGTAPQSGKVITDAVFNDPNASFNDKVAVKDVAEVANKEEQKQGVATATALSATLNNIPNEEKPEYQNYQNKRFNTPTEEVVTTETIPNASSSTLTTIGQGAGIQSIDATGTKDELEKEAIRQAKEEYKEIPTGVIEKLGVQDYYPEIGRDIAVGTFTGSRIGSQTIYSGAGGLLPMGLYDARKRALAETAKQKQAALDKIMNIKDTAPQFNGEYKPYAFDVIQNEIEKNGYDYNRLVKNKESMKEIIRVKTLGDEITYTDNYIKDIKKRYDDAKKSGGDVFIEEEILKQIDKFQRGITEDLPGVLSGKVKITGTMKDIRDYADGITQVDKMIKDYEFNKVEIPFNIKTKQEINASNIGELQDALVKIKSGRDVDKSMSVVKKYYDMDVTAMNDWLDEKGYDKDSPARKQIIDYYTKRIPAESFISKIETDPNKNFEYYKEANRKREADRDYNLKREQGKTHWTITNEQMNFVDKSSGKPINQLIGEWRGQGINGKALTEKIQSTMASNGMPVKFDPYLRSPVMIQQPSADEMKIPQQFSTQSTKVKVQVYRKDKRGKMGWFATEMKLEDLANLPSSKTKNYRLSEGAGNTPLSEVQKTYQEILTDKNARFFGTENYVAYGSVNTNTRNIERLSGDTYNTYDGSKPANIKVSNGNIVREVTYDDMGNPIPGTRVPGEFFFENEISTKAGQNTQDNIHGTGIQKYGGGGTTINSSSSYSSGGE